MYDAFQMTLTWGTFFMGGYSHGEFKQKHR